MSSIEESRTSAPAGGRVRVGCQGWNYADWVTPAGAGAPVFYPHATRAAAMLDLYARAFETVEVDSTFYAVPAATTVEGWRERAPDRFTFALKLPREITHEQSLGGAGAARTLTEFCARAALLREKLAAVLVQLPPQFAATPENRRALRQFVSLLPRELRFAFEFREASWFTEDALDVLAGRGHVVPALVEGPWVARERVWSGCGAVISGAEFAYVRWMGARNLTRFDRVARRQDANLSRWSAALRRLRELVPETYAYFSNFYEGHAPASANKLKRLLGQSVVEPNELESQPSLF